jgi:hypothetical protein
VPRIMDRRAEPVVIRCDVVLGDRHAKGFVLSLGEDGAAVVTEAAIALGQYLGLRLVLPWGMGHISARAEAIDSTAGHKSGRQSFLSGVGLSFVELHPRDQAAISRYVTRFRELAACLDYARE